MLLCLVVRRCLTRLSFRSAIFVGSSVRVVVSVGLCGIVIVVIGVLVGCMKRYNA